MRVISGSFGGRRLMAPRGLRTRPTSDRVREALFMALEPLDGLSIVDLFAGSGALGIEAVSRGAAHVDFVEPDRMALEALKSNIDALGIKDVARVWPLHLPQGLKRIAARMAAADLVLMDPPYGGDAARGMLARLGAAGVMRPDAQLVVEHHVRDGLPGHEGRLTQVRSRRYGETVITMYRAVDAGEGRKEGDA